MCDINIHQNGMIAGNSNILKSGKYSDLIICCGDHEFKVHRAIVCPRSNFFAAACDGEFSEAKSGRISLMEDDPDTVERMLSYLYTLKYDDGISNDTQDTETPKQGDPTGALTSDGAAETSDPKLETEVDQPAEDSLDYQQSVSDEMDEGELGLLVNMRVYALAEKYGILELKELAKSRFSKQAWDNWSRHEFLKILKEVFESTPSSDRGLRSVVTQICSKNIRALIANELFADIIKDTPGLGSGLFLPVLEYHDKQLGEVEAANTKLQEELNEGSKARKHIQEDRDRVQGILNRAIELSKGRSTCRHCDREFGSYFELANSSWREYVIMRCAKCHTRHE